MKDKLKRAIESKNEQELIKCLDHTNQGKFGTDSYDYIKQALIGTWHSQHEDLVNTIYLENLKDDCFVEPILNIAFNRTRYRYYDDELEPTLRKCVHALKTINSEFSFVALEKLKDMNNDNVKAALEMYN